VRRPKVSDDSSTVGLTADELDRLLSAAEVHGPRSAALVSLLVYNGLRIAEVLACDVEAFTHQQGHRVLRIVRKGGKASTEPLSRSVLRALEDYVGERTTGPLFLNAEGTERLSYSIAYKLIRRLARRAGIPAADKISPHSLRHSFATDLLGAGVPLQDVQDAMGHAGPRTTRAYDRSRHNLDRHPTYAMASHLRRGTPSATDDSEGLA
jgi:integrase/recombinase XerD